MRNARENGQLMGPLEILVQHLENSPGIENDHIKEDFL
jgi:hypothetical protein